MTEGVIGLPQKSRSEFCGKRSSEHLGKAARITSGLQNLLRCDKGSHKNRISDPGLPQKARGEFCGKRVSRRILGKSPVGSLPPANLEISHCGEIS